MNILSSLHAEYQQKLTTPEKAIAHIPSGSRMGIGMAVAEPPALLSALAARAEAKQIDNLRIYYYESTPLLSETILRYELTDRLIPYCMFITSVERDLIKRAQQDGRKVVQYVPSNFSQAPRLLLDHIGIETFAMAVAPMNENGYFNLGTGNDYASRVARQVKHLIVEVNQNMPRVYGDGALLHLSEVDSIVEHHAPLLEQPLRTPAAEDHTIGKIITELIPDGACLQMGVGALPNFICSQLMGHRNLGIHTEVLCPGMIDLIKAGVVTNTRKQIDVGKSVFTFSMGQQAMYDFIHNNQAIYSRPVDYVNDPAIIAQNHQAVSINATLQIDLTGACNSEHLLGHQYSATGGQLDFVRGAFASKGGKSIIVCRSTAQNGQVSRIVSRLDGPVTTPRTDTHYIVTEFGAANLKGLSSSERAKAIINLAHPQFRDTLTQAAKSLNLM